MYVFVHNDPTEIYSHGLIVPLMVTNDTTPKVIRRLIIQGNLEKPSLSLQKDVIQRFTFTPRLSPSNKTLTNVIWNPWQGMTVLHWWRKACLSVRNCLMYCAGKAWRIASLGFLQQKRNLKGSYFNTCSQSTKTLNPNLQLFDSLQIGFFSALGYCWLS